MGLLYRLNVSQDDKFLLKMWVLVTYICQKIKLNLSLTLFRPKDRDLVYLGHPKSTALDQVRYVRQWDGQYVLPCRLFSPDIYRERKRD